MPLRILIRQESKWQGLWMDEDILLQMTRNLSRFVASARQGLMKAGQAHCSLHFHPDKQWRSDPIQLQDFERFPYILE